MSDYEEYTWSYDGNRNQAEAEESEKTPDGLKEHESSNPNYKKKSEKEKVDDYKRQDYP